MKAPMISSMVLLIIAVSSSYFIANSCLNLNQILTLIIYIITATAALISVIFIIYGYYINLAVFKESQKPKLILQVHNDRINLNDVNVHQTLIRYANLSQNECRGLILKVFLIKDQDKVIIPRLFSENITLPPTDDRTRSFPTLAYLKENNIPKLVIDNLDKYKLRVSYSYVYIKEEFYSQCDYEWNSQDETWNIV